MQLCLLLFTLYFCFMFVHRRFDTLIPTILCSSLSIRFGLCSCSLWFMICFNANGSLIRVGRQSDIIYHYIYGWLLSSSTKYLSIPNTSSEYDHLHLRMYGICASLPVRSILKNILYFSPGDSLNFSSDYVIGIGRTKCWCLPVDSQVSNSRDSMMM